MCDKGTAMFNMELGIEVSELFVVKLSIVVGDDGLREVESIDDVLPYEFFSLDFDDLSHRLGFYPFVEIVYGHEQKLLLC